MRVQNLCSDPSFHMHRHHPYNLASFNSKFESQHTNGFSSHWISICIVVRLVCWNCVMRKFVRFARRTLFVDPIKMQLKKCESEKTTQHQYALGSLVDCTQHRSKMRKLVQNVRKSIGSKSAEKVHLFCLKWITVLLKNVPWLSTTANVWQLQPWIYFLRNSENTHIGPFLIKNMGKIFSSSIVRWCEIFQWKYACENRMRMVPETRPASLILIQ